MALPGELAILAIMSEYSVDQIQPAGIDLRVESVELFIERGFLGVKDRSIPRTIPVEGSKWFLQPGFYKIIFRDPVYIPETAVGLCFPRSSLLRMGAMVQCAVWDPGYRGKGEALLVVGNPRGILLEKGARIAQLVLIRVGYGYSGRYQGVYQGEKLEK